MDKVRDLEVLYIEGKKRKKGSAFTMWIPLPFDMLPNLPLITGALIELPASIHTEEADHISSSVII